MQYLRQSTSADVVLGPFVDDTDGKSTEESLTLSSTDLYITKNGGTASAKTQVSAATHLYGGNYTVPLSSTDTNTLGTMTLMCKESGALPVVAHFQVVTANWWDSMCASDKLDVNVEEWDATSVPSAHTSGYPIVTIKDGTGTGEIDTASGRVLADTVYIAGSAVSPTAAQIGVNIISAAATAWGSGAITSAVIATGAITSTKIATGAITSATLATDAITSASISTDAITEIQSGLATAAQVSAIGSGTGAALNFEVNDDNTGTTGDTILDSVTQVGSATGGTTFANTQADNNVYHSILSVDTGGGTWVIDWVYKFACGGGRNATKFVTRAFMSAIGDTCLVQAYDHAGTDWETIGTITGTTETLYDLPLYTKHTGTGAAAGNVYIRFINTGDQGDTQTLNIDLAYVQAQNLGQTTGYADGSLWVKATGTAGTTPYVNGTADNPAPWASIKTLNTTLGLNRYVVAPGTTVTLDAALTGAVMRGRSYVLALGGQNISQSYFEGVEGLSGTGTCASGEAIIVDSHLNAVTIGEADFIRCHLMNEITLSQASVPYRFHDCTGITSAKVTFNASSQTAVISRASGVFTIAGMAATNTLYLDGNADVTLDNTNSSATVYVAGNIRLTNNGTGISLTDTARWGEDQNITNVTGTVAGLGNTAKSDVNAEVVDVLGTDPASELAAAPAANASLKSKITWLAMHYRNKLTQTSSETVIFADDTTTPVAASDVEDDSTTFTRGEWH